MVTRLVVVAMCAVALVGTIGGYLKARDYRVEKDFAVRVEKQAEKKDAKAQTARAAAAARPDGVLSRYCRDCGKSGSVPIVEAGDGIKK